MVLHVYFFLCYETLKHKNLSDEMVPLLITVLSDS